MTDDDPSATRFDRYFRRHPEQFPVLVAVIGWGLGVALYGAVVAVTVAVGGITVTWYLVLAVALAGVLPGFLGYRHAAVLQAAIRE